MHRLMLAVSLVAAAAWAGERFLGTTEALAPLGGTNFYSDAGGFRVPPNAKLTVWCTAPAFLYTDSVANVFSDGGLGDAGTATAVVYPTARVLFPTSVGPSRFYLTLDGGAAWPANGGGIVRTASDTSAAKCHWFERLGTE